MRPDAILVEAHLAVLRDLARRLDDTGHRSAGDVNKGSLPYARWFVDHALELGPLLPLDKLARWVGFVQGVMAAHGVLDVDVERDRTRALFHQAYGALGVGREAV